MFEQDAATTPPMLRSVPDNTGRFLSEINFFERNNYGNSASCMELKCSLLVPGAESLQNFVPENYQKVQTL